MRREVQIIVDLVQRHLPVSISPAEIPGLTYRFLVNILDFFLQTRYTTSLKKIVNLPMSFPSGTNDRC